MPGLWYSVARTAMPNTPAPSQQQSKHIAGRRACRSMPRSDHSGPGRCFPQGLPAQRIIGHETSIGCPLKHDVSSSRQRAAIPRRDMLDRAKLPSAGPDPRQISRQKAGAFGGVPLNMKPRFSRSYFRVYRAPPRSEQTTSPASDWPAHFAPAGRRGQSAD